MTPQQIAEAQKLALECRQRNFKGCDDEESVTLFSDIMQFVPLIVIILAGIGIYWFVKRSSRRKVINVATPVGNTGQTVVSVTAADISSNTVEKVTPKPMKRKG